MVYAGSEAQGSQNGVMEPTKEEAAFKKIEPDSSDQELYQRVCKPAKAAPAKPPKKG